jgi:hypothetical protein
MVKKNNKRRKGSKRSQRRNNTVARNGMFTPGQTNNALQSQRVVFSIVYQPQVVQNAPDDPMKGFLPIDPIHALLNSPYRSLADIYAKMRVRKYSATLWIPRVSVMVPGSLATILARDSVFFNRDLISPCEKPPTANDSYAYFQIIMLPGCKNTRLHQTHNYTWRPIEPIDRSWFNPRTVCPNIDEGVPNFGMLSFAAVLDNVDSIVTPSYTPLVKLTFDVDFAYILGIGCDAPTMPNNVPVGPRLPIP